LQLSSGVNYTGRSISDLLGAARDLPEGTETMNGAGSIESLTERRVDQATFGWYIEPSINHQRLWISTGIRLDGGSTFGSRVKLPSFPKLSVSYLVSDEPFVPDALQSVFRTLRLRAAYGHAGRPPGPTDRLRLYGSPEMEWVDGQFVDAVTLRSLGNRHL